jgi:hypothetical protein
MISASGARFSRLPESPSNRFWGLLPDRGQTTNDVDFDVSPVGSASEISAPPILRQAPFWPYTYVQGLA